MCCPTVRYPRLRSIVFVSTCLVQAKWTSEPPYAAVTARLESFFVEGDKRLAETGETICDSFFSADDS